MWSVVLIIVKRGKQVGAYKIKLHKFKKTDLFKVYLHKYLKICTPNKLPNRTINVDIAIIIDERWPSECVI